MVPYPPHLLVYLNIELPPKNIQKIIFLVLPLLSLFQAKSTVLVYLITNANGVSKQLTILRTFQIMIPENERKRFFFKAIFVITQKDGFTAVGLIKDLKY